MSAHAQIFPQPRLRLLRKIDAEEVGHDRFKWSLRTKIFRLNIFTWQAIERIDLWWPIENSYRFPKRVDVGLLIKTPER